MTVSNDEVFDLIFDISKRGTGAAGDLGGVLGNCGGYAQTGMAWVEDVLYVLDYSNGQLKRYDIETQTIDQSYSIHSSPFGMAWDGSLLWIGNNSGFFRGYDLDGTYANASFKPLQAVILQYHGMVLILSSTITANQTRRFTSWTKLGQLLKVIPPLSAVVPWGRYGYPHTRGGIVGCRFQL